MSLDQHFCILCKQTISGLEEYADHRSSGKCGVRRISDQSSAEMHDLSPDGLQSRADLAPPIGHTGGKWKPGLGPADMYLGYRIVDSSEERAAGPCLDPVAEKIHNIRLSLTTGAYDANVLKQEQRKCVRQFPFVCRVCPFYSTQMSSFTWHLNSCQHNLQTAKMEMRCQICSFTCHRMADLIKHFNWERKKKRNNLIASEYLKGTIFSCEIQNAISCSFCDRKFRLRISERIHCQKEHLNRIHVPLSQPGEDLTPEAGRLTCPLCSSEHSTRGNLRQHMARHAPPTSRSFPCPSCSSTFAVRSDLVKHSAVHSKRKSFRCQECSHAAKSLQTLRKHQKVHRSEKPFKCLECMFSCKLSSNLRRHQRIHSGAKPYHCPHCHYRTGNQENLRKHILTSKKHEGLTMYVCDACSYGCNNFSQYKDHMREEHHKTNIRSIFFDKNST